MFMKKQILWRQLDEMHWLSKLNCHKDNLEQWYERCTPYPNFHCLICGNLFASLYFMNIHMERVHIQDGHHFHSHYILCHSLWLSYWYLFPGFFWEIHFWSCWKVICWRYGVSLALNPTLSSLWCTGQGPSPYEMYQTLLRYLWAFS